MKVDVLLGLQWGDEGKGKIVDFITPDYELIARFQGGPNAGHTLEFEGRKHVLHTVPSGIFHENTMNIIGNGVVIDPVILRNELENCSNYVDDIRKNVCISRKAHLILPTHRLLDAASEAAKGNLKIGSTLKGIGPAYMDMTGRNGLRIGDIERADFMDCYRVLREKHIKMLRHYDFAYNLEEYESSWLEGIEYLRQFEFVDGDHVINEFLKEDKTVLAEGAQGSLLDINYGTYPFVTSSNTICAGACTGLGVAPSKIGKVFGIFKAYCTRVGSGPFPTELSDSVGELMQKNGNEFGSTTGRARRCGWLDMVALKYSCQINGVTSLIMMKADVLSGFEEIKVATKYIVNGEEVDHLPYNLDDAVPVYETMKGWKEDITNCKTFESLPQALKDYIGYIEDSTGVSISIVSVGPQRTQTIIR